MRGLGFMISGSFPGGSRDHPRQDRRGLERNESAHHDEEQEAPAELTFRKKISPSWLAMPTAAAQITGLWGEIIFPSTPPEASLRP